MSPERHGERVGTVVVQDTLGCDSAEVSRDQ